MSDTFCIYVRRVNCVGESKNRWRESMKTERSIKITKRGKNVGRKDMYMYNMYYTLLCFTCTQEAL